MSHRCERCGLEYYYTLERCPHCAHPGNYSNVVIASDERDAIDSRYETAVRNADSRGCRPQLEAFSDWLLSARVVLARPYADVNRLSAGDNSVQATYYDLIDAGLRLPDGSLWEQLRRPADEILFPHYREKIRFGALSGDGVGVINYGHFWLTLRTDFIAHRTSFYDQNSVALVSRMVLRSAPSNLRGHRATWEDRAKLATAQLQDHISASSGPSDFTAILVEQGPTTEEDRFIEANIWGSLTVRTVESVKYSRSLVRSTPRSLLNGLRLSLSRFGTTLEELP